MLIYLAHARRRLNNIKEHMPRSPDILAYRHIGICQNLESSSLKCERRIIPRLARAQGKVLRCVENVLNCVHGAISSLES